MSNRKTYKLGEIASVQTGPFGSQLHQADYVINGTPIITVEHLGENRLTHENLPRVSDDDKERLKKYHLKKRDIVFSRVGSVDRRAFVKQEEEGWLFSGRCLRVRANHKIADGQFLSYFFGLESFKKRIRGIAVGATMPSLNTSIMTGLEITLPTDISEQIQIAKILSSLDDKIELNLQMNQTLETMAQTLFKEWFVNFNFPKCLNLDSPDSLDEPDLKKGNKNNHDNHDNPKNHSSDILVDGLPKGWRIDKLREVLEIRYGKDYKHLESGNIPLYGSGGIMKYVNKALYENDSILIPRKGTLSNLFYLSKPFWSVDTMFYSKIKNEYHGKYLFYLLKTLDLASMNVGSAVPSLTTEILNNLLITIPSNDILKQFEELITPIYLKMESNIEENQTLTQLRDNLLPKLMSGKIEVTA
jgi:type I restriction enzyme, S subunit